MSSNIQQLELSFDFNQDRLLLIIYTQDFAEFRFWLTRRFTKIFWGALIQLLQNDQKNPSEREKESQQIAQQFQKEQTQRQPAASKYSHKMSRTPLGPDPMLLSRLSGRPSEHGAFILILEDAHRHHFEIRADSKILLSFCKLISEAVKKADWNLEAISAFANQ